MSSADERYQEERYDCVIVTPSYNDAPGQVRFSRPGKNVEEPAYTLLIQEMEADGVVFDTYLTVDDQVRGWMDKYPHRYHQQYQDRVLDFNIQSPNGDRGLSSLRIQGDSEDDLRMLELLATVSGPESMTEDLRRWMFSRDIDGVATARGLVYDFPDSKLCDYDDLYLRCRFSISWENLRRGAARLCALVRG